MAAVSLILGVWERVLGRRDQETKAVEVDATATSLGTNSAVSAMQAAIGYLQTEVKDLRDQQRRDRVRLSEFGDALDRCEADKAELRAELARLAG